MVELNIQLPDSFFEEEERDGYLVSAKTKELWAVELDLLYEFDRVCKKHNLKYMLDFGTLLGAVRHKGFIPWDDDIDVAMLREDYEKLLEVAPQEFKNPYFLQSYRSEQSFCDAVTKLRRCDTSCIMSVDVTWKKSNHGIFIDIFVYDSLSSDNCGQLTEIIKFSESIHHRMRKMATIPSISDGWKLFLRYYYYNIRYGSTYRQYKKLDQFAKTFNVGPYKASILSQMHRLYKSEWFDEIVEMPFENLMLPISASFDAILKLLYGDYMTPVIGSSAHSVIYYDTERPYSEVMNDRDLMKKLQKRKFFV